MHGDGLHQLLFMKHGFFGTVKKYQLAFFQLKTHSFEANLIMPERDL